MHGGKNSSRSALCENALSDMTLLRFWPEDWMMRFVVGDNRSQSTLFPEQLEDYLSEVNPHLSEAHGGFLTLTLRRNATRMKF
jgi:hypothetical protein